MTKIIKAWAHILILSLVVFSLLHFGKWLLFSTPFDVSVVLNNAWYTAGGAALWEIHCQGIR